MSEKSTLSWKDRYAMIFLYESMRGDVYKVKYGTTEIPYSPKLKENGETMLELDFPRTPAFKLRSDGELKFDRGINYQFILDLNKVDPEMLRFKIDVEKRWNRIKGILRSAVEPNPETVETYRKDLQGAPESVDKARIAALLQENLDVQLIDVIDKILAIDGKKFKPV